jgi:hypothetical protein
MNGCSSNAWRFLHNRRVRGVIAVGAVLWLVSTAAGAPGRLQTIEVFRTPTKNIACGYVTGLGAPASLRCDIRSGLRPEPKRACELAHWQIS